MRNPRGHRFVGALVCLIAWLPGCRDDGGGLATTISRLEVSPTELAWSETIVGTRALSSLTLRNTGDVAVRISRAAVLDGLAFSVGAVPEELAPGESALVDVTFLPTEAREHVGRLRVDNTSANAPGVDVALHGVAREPPACDDGNACTMDQWDPASGTCVAAPISGPCDDGNPCTAHDQCSAGSCLGFPVTCDDGVACTVDLCDPDVGCTAVPDSAQCVDDDPCTDDICDATGCSHVPSADGTACGSVTSCSTMPICMGGRCVAAPVPDGYPCGFGCASNAVCVDGRCAGEPGLFPEPACPGACGNGVRETCANCPEGTTCTSSCGVECPACCYEPSLREPCDGVDLGAVDCVQLGFAGGTLACADTCHWDSAGCSSCTDHPAIRACVRPPVKSRGAGNLALAAHDGILAGVWLEWTERGAGTVHFASWDTELQLLRAQCLELTGAVDVALSATTQGWMLATGNEELLLHPLDIHGDPVTEPVSLGPIAISWRDNIALTPGAPGTTLVVWQPEHSIMESALVQDDGTVLWRNTLAHRTYVNNPSALYVEDHFLVAFRVNNGMWVVNINHDGTLEEVHISLEGMDYPRLAWNGEEVALTTAAFNGTHGVMWTRLTPDGALLDTPALVGSFPLYFNPSPVVSTREGWLMLLPGYTGAAGVGSHLDALLVTRGDGVGAPQSLTREPAFEEFFQLVPVADGAVAGWISDDINSSARRIQLMRIEPGALAAPAPSRTSAPQTCIPPWKHGPACGDALCGNGVTNRCTRCPGSVGCSRMERTESCDGTAPTTCGGLGYASGTLGCNERCGWDVSACNGCMAERDCARIPVDTNAAVSLAVAGRDDGEIAAVWSYIGEGPNYTATLRLARTKESFQVLDEKCLGIHHALSVALAPTSDGWLLASDFREHSGDSPDTVEVRTLDRTGDVIRGPTFTARVGTGVAPDLSLTPGHDGTLLLFPGVFSALAAILLDDDGVAKWRAELMPGGTVTEWQAVATERGYLIAASAYTGHVWLFPIFADAGTSGAVEAGPYVVLPVGSHLRLARMETGAVLFWVEWTNAGAAVKWRRLASDGNPVDDRVEEVAPRGQVLGPVITGNRGVIALRGTPARGLVDETVTGIPVHRWDVGSTSRLRYDAQGAYEHKLFTAGGRIIAAWLATSPWPPGGEDTSFERSLYLSVIEP
ncbi:MAG: hypothetical protein AB2A00_29490 [Myxococcota bacterium]